METHLTLHENGEYSVIHKGMPVTRSQDLLTCRKYIRQYFPKIGSIAIWDAANGRFLTVWQTV